MLQGFSRIGAFENHPGDRDMVAVCRTAGLTVRLFPPGKSFVRSSTAQIMIILGFVVVGLSGCGVSRPLEQDDAGATPINLDDALSECRNGYPNQITQAVARAACVVKATEPLRPLL